MQAALQNSVVGSEYRDLVRNIDAQTGKEFEASVERLRGLTCRLAVPQEIPSEVCCRAGNSMTLMVRSSANCEDLESFAAAGLYESVANVLPQNVNSAIQQVWASLWTRRAAESRKAAGIRHEQAHMAVLVQEFFDPDFAFVLHTVSPVSQDPGILYAELVVGLGETLASAFTAGTPYRLSCRKPNGPTEILAFANFTHALHADPAAGVRKEILNYSRVRLSQDYSALERLGGRLAEIGAIVETAFNGPQDIEGFVVNDRIYLVQARPQQGLTSRTIK
jgi:phosphoenolpyruvate synthase/pyruvate phosphate dikinase